MASKNGGQIISDLADELEKASVQTFKLIKPVPDEHEELIKEVTVNADLSGADVEAIANVGDKEGTAMIMIVSRATGLPSGLVRSMSGRDIKRINRFVQDFLSSDG